MKWIVGSAVCRLNSQDTRQMLWHAFEAKDKGQAAAYILRHIQRRLSGLKPRRGQFMYLLASLIDGVEVVRIRPELRRQIKVLAQAKDPSKILVHDRYDSPTL